MRARTFSTSRSRLLGSISRLLKACEGINKGIRQLCGECAIAIPLGIELSQHHTSAARVLREGRYRG